MWPKCGHAPTLKSASRSKKPYLPAPMRRSRWRWRRDLNPILSGCSSGKSIAEQRRYITGDHPKSSLFMVNCGQKVGTRPLPATLLNKH